MYTHTPDTRPLRLRVYPLWGGSFSLRGRASLDRRANLNGRAILQGRISFCPPLEVVRAMQEQEGGERGRVGREAGREGRFGGQLHCIDGMEFAGRPNKKGEVLLTGGICTGGGGVWGGGVLG